MLDEFIERWGGYASIGIGVAAVAVSVAGYLFFLPPRSASGPS